MRWRRAPNRIPLSAGYLENNESVFCSDLGVFLKILVFHCRDFPYDLIANILVSLTMKDTGTVLRFLMGSEEVER